MYMHIRDKHNTNTQGDLVDVDGVGTVYIVPAHVFLNTTIRYSDDQRLTEHWYVHMLLHTCVRDVCLVLK